MEKEVKINEVYTLTIGDLDGMLNDFLSDLGIDEDVITQNQVEQLAVKLIDRLLLESDPSKWVLNPSPDSKRAPEECERVYFKVAQFSSPKKYCVDTLENVIEEIKAIEAEHHYLYRELNNNQADEALVIHTVLITKEEFNNLPDFEGF